MRLQLVMPFSTLFAIQAFGCATAEEPTRDEMPSEVRATSSAFEDEAPLGGAGPGAGTECKLVSQTKSVSDSKDADIVLSWRGNSITISLMQMTDVTYTATFLDGATCTLVHYQDPNSMFWKNKAVITEDSMNVKCNASLSGNIEASIKQTNGYTDANFNYEYGGTYMLGKTLDFTIASSFPIANPIRLSVRGKTAAEAQLDALHSCINLYDNLRPGVKDVQQDYWNTWTATIENLKESDFTFSEPWTSSMASAIINSHFYMGPIFWPPLDSSN
jgi:hypothetical protein